MTDVTAPIQKASDGFGPLFHRIYSVDLQLSAEQARESMKRLQHSVNVCCPQLLARFEKTKGDEETLKVGDEFLIHITGPWNGPVTVSSVTDSQFALKTLEGHLEAGEIYFRVLPAPEGRTRFEIESLARSRDRVVDFVYDKVPVARVAQTQMWEAFCRNFAALAENREPAEMNERPVNIITEKRDPESGRWQEV